MKIEAENFIVTISHNDLWDTAFDVRQQIEYSLQRHYVNNQQNWKENEKYRLNRCRTMFFALGRPDLFEEIFNTADEIFKVFNSKLTQ